MELSFRGGAVGSNPTPWHVTNRVRDGQSLVIATVEIRTAAKVF